MKWQDEQSSSNVEDLRGQSGSSGFGGGGMGGGGGLLAIAFQLFGWKGLMVGGAVLLITKFAGGVGGIHSGAGALHDAGAGPAASYQESPQEHQDVEFVRHILGSTETVWGTEMQAIGKTYPPPRLVLYSNQTPTGCGQGQAAAGPFYCPADQKLYLDLAFFQELGTRFGAPGEFAKAYVIAHEVGHHIQYLTGIDKQVRQAQASASKTEQNRIQVRMELQADCFAGVWANKADAARHTLEAGDIDQAMQAAAGVGDDRLQEQATGTVRPDAFTHGTSAQRKHWLTTGFQAGDIKACDTFATGAL